MGSVRRWGGTVDYLAGDISDPAHVERLRQWVQTQGGPLDGLLHAAGTLDLERFALRSKTPGSFAAVLSPKVVGTCRLWRCCAQRLILFSSIGSLSAPLAAGQSDYAAANRFQRDFAAACGAPAVQAVILSEWGAVGMLQQNQVGPIVRRLGLAPFRESER